MQTMIRNLQIKKKKHKLVNVIYHINKMRNKSLMGTKKHLTNSILIYDKTLNIADIEEIHLNI